MLNSNFFGFTIAEVLITLGIIGVVAGLTIPTIIKKQEEISTVSKLKKIYSTLSQASLQAIQDNGTPDNWDLKGVGDQDGAVNAFKMLIPYLRVAENCGKSNGCFPQNVYYKFLNGGDQWNLYASTNMARIKLADGTPVGIRISDETCSNTEFNVCASIYIDTNGVSSPNQYGRDTFNFILTKRGIIPSGLPTAPSTLSIFDDDCRDKTTANGHGCVAWVIYNENMDYLKCSDLSWDGKHKCGG